MAKTANQSALLSKIKKTSKGAWKRSREKAPQVKGQMIPGGIVNGIGKLASWKFDKDKKNNPYFSINGVCQLPEEYKGYKINLYYPIKEDQYKSIEDRLDKLSNDLQLLGADISEMEIDDIPEVIAELVEQKALFFFNTWTPPKQKGNDNPNTIIFVQGVADEEDLAAVEEEEEDTEEEIEEEEEEEKPTKRKRRNKPNIDEEEEIEEEEEEIEEEDTEEDTEEEIEEVEIAIGDIYAYKATPKGKALDCEIISINEEKEAVNLKRLSDNKVFKNVSWDRLEESA